MPLAWLSLKKAKIWSKALWSSIQTQLPRMVWSLLVNLTSARSHQLVQSWKLSFQVYNCMETQLRISKNHPPFRSRPVLVIEVKVMVKLWHACHVSQVSSFMKSRLSRVFVNNVRNVGAAMVRFQRRRGKVTGVHHLLRPTISSVSIRMPVSKAQKNIQMVFAKWATTVYFVPIVLEDSVEMAPLSAPSAPLPLWMLSWARFTLSHW